MFAQRQPQASLPKVLWLTLTYKCNNRCQGCYVGPAGFPKDSNMSTELAEKTLLLAVELGIPHCTLIGGEPTVHPALPGLVAFGSRLGLKIGMVTNGRKMSNELLVSTLKDCGLNSVTISIEGTEKVHEKIVRRKGSFQEVLQGMENCARFDLRFSTLTTISKLNSEDLPSLIGVLSEVGVRRMTFNILVPNVDTGEQDYTGYDPSEYSRIVSNLYYHSKGKVKCSFFVFIPLCLFPEEALRDMLADNALRVGCHVYRGKGLIIDPWGRVLPCNHWTGVPMGAIRGESAEGKVLSKREFLTFWFEGVPSEVRKAMWRYPSRKCIGCQLWGWCLGGCPLIWKVYNPQEIIPGFR